MLATAAVMAVRIWSASAATRSGRDAVGIYVPLMSSRSLSANLMRLFAWRVSAST